MVQAVRYAVNDAGGVLTDGTLCGLKQHSGLAQKIKIDSFIAESATPLRVIQRSASGSRLPFLFMSINISVLAHGLPDPTSTLIKGVAEKNPKYVLYAGGVAPLNVVNSPAFHG